MKHSFFALGYYYATREEEKKDYVKIIINDHTQHKNQKLYSTEFF